MGSSHWSNDYYADRTADRAKTGASPFVYDTHIRSNPTAPKVTHDKMSPKGIIRESRDSDAHPNSVAIGVMLDVTGSMVEVPKVLQANLPQLMGTIIRKGYLADPQVLFGGIGDFYSDSAPLQVGQFESGIEVDDDLGRLFLEGNGGGQNKESYQNALYFFARKTSIDCFEKRGKQGYLFLIGDEAPYPTSTPEEIKQLIGDTIPAPVPIATLIAEVRERYHVFFLIPSGASHTHEGWLKKAWTELLGPENVIMLDDPKGVSEAIAGIVGICEGAVDGAGLALDLKDSGSSAGVIASVTKALDPLAKSAMVKVGTGAALADKPRSTSNVRL